MLVPKDGEDTLPFDELDPCCQKEIEIARKKKIVSEKLRTVDRSLRRLQEQDGVLCVTDPSDAWRCFCCRLGGDYPALAKLRQEMAEYEIEGDHETETDKPVRERGSDSDADDSDDDDDLLLDIDLPLTPYEQERLAYAKQREQEVSLSKSFGLGIHIEDSLEHILTYTQQQPSIPLILHIYQPDSYSCAKVDYVLEGKLSESYLGTRFRRLRYFSTLSSDNRLLSAPFGQELTWKLHVLGGDPLIVCIRGDSSKLLACITDYVGSLGESLEDIARNLVNSFEHAHALITELPSLPILKLGIPRNENVGDGVSGGTVWRVGGLLGEREREGEEEEEIERYCDDPDCTKRYQHEHVARRGVDGKLITTASFVNSNAKGLEALAPNAMLKM